MQGGGGCVQCVCTSHLPTTNIHHACGYADPEILERRYPVVLQRFCLRRGSGGPGVFAGGDGVIREVSTRMQQLTAAVSPSNVRQMGSLDNKHDGAQVLCHYLAGSCATLKVAVGCLFPSM